MSEGSGLVLSSSVFPLSRLSYRAHNQRFPGPLNLLTADRNHLASKPIQACDRQKATSSDNRPTILHHTRCRNRAREERNLGRYSARSSLTWHERGSDRSGAHVRLSRRGAPSPPQARVPAREAGGDGGPSARDLRSVYAHPLSWVGRNRLRVLRATYFAPLVLAPR